MDAGWQGETFKWQRRGESQVRFFWHGTGCGLDLKNLRREEGHIYADVHAHVHKSRVLVRPKVNVTSDRSLPGLVKSLTKASEYEDGAGATRTPCDWGVFLDSMVAVLVDEMDEKGEVHWLEPLDGAALAQPMLFRNFVPAGLLSGLVAHGGTGKSLTGMLMALAVATGRKVGPFEPLRQGAVLYADWENQWDLHGRRLTRICHGLGIDFPRGVILHYGARGKLTQAEPELVEMAYDHKVVLTIFDSIGFASGGNLNDSDVATAAVNAIKHIPETKVMIAHLSKAAVAGEAPKAPSGNAFYWNGPQAIYDLRATEPEADGSVVLTIYQNKANVGAKLRRPLGARVEFHDDERGGPIVPAEYIVEGHMVGGEGLPEKTRVLDFLRSCDGRPVTATAVAEALYEEPERSRMDSVARTLRRLRDEGAAEELAAGESKGGRGHAGQWVIKGRALTTGEVDDNDRCHCGSLAIVAYDASGAPRCEAHKPEGAW